MAKPNIVMLIPNATNPAGAYIQVIPAEIVNKPNACETVANNETPYIKKSGTGCSTSLRDAVALSNAIILATAASILRGEPLCSFTIRGPSLSVFMTALEI